MLRRLAFSDNLRHLWDATAPLAKTKLGLTHPKKGVYSLTVATSSKKRMAAKERVTTNLRSIAKILSKGQLQKTDDVALFNKSVALLNQAIDKHNTKVTKKCHKGFIGFLNKIPLIKQMVNGLLGLRPIKLIAPKGNLPPPSPQPPAPVHPTPAPAPSPTVILPPGVGNIGATCYLASSLQTIAHIPFYQAAFDSQNILQKKKDESNEDFQRRQDLQKWILQAVNEIKKGQSPNDGLIKQIVVHLVYLGIVSANRKEVIDNLDKFQKSLEGLNISSTDARFHIKEELLQRIGLAKLNGKTPEEIQKIAALLTYFDIMEMQNVQFDSAEVLSRLFDKLDYTGTNLKLKKRYDFSEATFEPKKIDPAKPETRKTPIQDYISGVEIEETNSIGLFLQLATSFDNAISGELNSTIHDDFVCMQDGQFVEYKNVHAHKTLEAGPKILTVSVQEIDARTQDLTDIPLIWTPPGSKDSYRLISLIYKSGSNNGGHYYAFLNKAKHAHEAPRWVCCNDGNVSERAPQGIELTRARAYFYEKIEPLAITAFKAG